MTLEKVISTKYSERDIHVSETEIRLAADRFVGFVDLLTKIKKRRDAELAANTAQAIPDQDTSFHNAHSDILEEI